MFRRVFNAWARWRIRAGHARHMRKWARLDRRQQAANKHLATATAAVAAARDDTAIATAYDKLRTADEKHAAAISSAEASLDVAGRTIRALSVEIDELRGTLRVNAATIATLVAANELHLHRYEAESAIEVRRKTIVALPREVA